MNTETERSTDKEREWPVWTGSMEDLYRLAAAVEQMIETRRKSLLASFDEQTRQELEAASDKLGSEQERETLEKRVGSEQIEFVEQVFARTAKDRRESERASLEKRLTITTTLVDGDDTIKGDAANILAELDRRSVNSVEISMWSYDERVKVTLDRRTGKSYGSGATLRVTSVDPGWARQTFAYLSDEISKGEPKYSWIRKPFGRLVVACASGIAPTLAVVLMILPGVPGKDRLAVWLFAIYAFFALAGIGGVSSRFHDWLAPRFEVVGDDGQSTGGRRIGAVAAPILAIILGIIVNRIYA